VRALVRETGSGAPFVDLATGYDLDALTPGVAVAFDLKFAAAGFAGYLAVQMTLAVTRDLTAAWAG